jgi:hypothetical protein
MTEGANKRNNDFYNRLQYFSIKWIFFYFLLQNDFQLNQHKIHKNV